MRLGLGVLLAFACVSPACALDEVVLKNGRRYLGTIVANTPNIIILSIDGGTVEFPRSMVTSPPYLGPVDSENTTSTATTPNIPAPDTPGPDSATNHPLPGVPDALENLRSFPWVAEIRQVPALVTDQGRWQFLPCVSFWVADFFQLSFYGDPARPSAIEVSLHHPPETAWDQKRRLLEYMLSLSPGLAADNRFDALDVRGDQFSIGDLWFEVTSPESAKSPGRWVVLLVHELSLNAARASSDDLQVISELVTSATIDPSKPRSWQRATWLPDELAWVRQAPGAGRLEAPDPDGGPARTATFTAHGGERVFVRAFARERGKYLRATNDWTRDFATTAR